MSQAVSEKKEAMEAHAFEFDKHYQTTPWYRAIKSGKQIRDFTEILPDGKLKTKLRFYYPAFSKTIFRMAQIQDGHTILDIGCGFGNFLIDIEKKYPKCKLFGIDISYSMIDAAAQNFPLAQFGLSPAESLPVADNSLDRIISREVFEHVISPQKMINEIYRVLKPGGIAVITTPNGSVLTLANLKDKFKKGRLGRLKDEALTLQEAHRVFRTSGFNGQ